MAKKCESNDIFSGMLDTDERNGKDNRNGAYVVTALYGCAYRNRRRFAAATA